MQFTYCTGQHFTHTYLLAYSISDLIHMVVLESFMLLPFGEYSFIYFENKSFYLRFFNLTQKPKEVVEDKPLTFPPPPPMIVS